MLTSDILSSEDWALIEHEGGTAPRALYAPPVHESLPDRFAALLEQLVVREPKSDETTGSVYGGSEGCRVSARRPYISIATPLGGKAHLGRKAHLDGAALVIHLS